ncbi:virulence RhuM family protein [Patescibacteria group bacterium]|nr:virulence RhuM family protein [Patescibacteria group bacterium]
MDIKDEKLVIYQSKSGAIEFRKDLNQETIWANLKQITELFQRDKSVISRHIKNIFKSGELRKTSTVAKIATVQKEGTRRIAREIEYFNLDVIISIGYRVDSKNATQFRIWATKVLKQHIVDGYTINKKRISHNYEKFIKAVSDVKALLPKNASAKTEDILDLIKVYATTWFSLDAYDKDTLPRKGISKKRIEFTAKELNEAINQLKNDLLNKKQATDIFAQERSKNSIESVVGNIFQSAFGKDAYPTMEEKAAHLLYFIVKNHPFTDGNKRSGAFAFVWFLGKAGLLRAGVNPEALTVLTLLIAESNPKDKEKMTGLVLLLINRK